MKFKIVRQASFQRAQVFTSDIQSKGFPVPALILKSTYFRMFLQNVSILKYQPREGWTYRGKVWSFVCVCVCVLNQTPFVENNSFQRPHTTILQPSSVAKNEIPRTCNAADFCLCTSSHCSHCLPPSLSGFANKREWPLVSSFK